MKGFALLVVLWVVAILSAVSLALITSTRAEARSASGEWDQLAGQRLARSGQEFALYLRSRAIGTPSENLAGLPVDPEISGFRYKVHFPEGVVRVVLDSDDGKISPVSADRQFLQNFFTLWTANSLTGVSITDGIKNWTDQYHRIGIADFPLMRGLSVDDFRPVIVGDPSDPLIRESLEEFITLTPGNTQINPNFAPKLVLRSIPGLGGDQVEVLVQARKRGVFFKNADDLKSVISAPPESEVWRYFRYDRASTPSVFTITESNAGRRQHSERRVSELIAAFTGIRYEATPRLLYIAVDRLPQYLRD